MQDTHNATAPQTYPSGAALLAELLAAQEKCAPVTLTIGGVTPSGQVEHGVIYVTNAPPKVVRGIMAACEFVSITPQGLRINVKA